MEQNLLSNNHFDAKNRNSSIDKGKTLRFHIIPYSYKDDSCLLLHFGHSNSNNDSNSPTEVP